VVIAGKARLREFGYIAGKDDLRRINRLGGPIATLPKRAAVTPLFCYGYVVGGTGNGSDLLLRRANGQSAEPLSTK
jgi:hypothetical protein